MNVLLLRGTPSPKRIRGTFPRHAPTRRTCFYAESSASAGTHKDADDCMDAHGRRARALRSLARSSSYQRGQIANRCSVTMVDAAGTQRYGTSRSERSSRSGHVAAWP
jgi:hypothetical protein